MSESHQLQLLQIHAQGMPNAGTNQLRERIRPK